MLVYDEVRGYDLHAGIDERLITEEVGVRV